MILRQNTTLVRDFFSYEYAKLAHLILAMPVSNATLILSVELVVDRNVQISSVAVVGTAGQLA